MTCPTSILRILKRFMAFACFFVSLANYQYTLVCRIYISINHIITKTGDVVGNCELEKITSRGFEWWSLVRRDSRKTSLPGPLIVGCFERRLFARNVHNRFYWTTFVNFFFLQNCIVLYVHAKILTFYIEQWGCLHASRFEFIPVWRQSVRYSERDDFRQVWAVFRPGIE
jgi:hypothetical protein